jgi:hypothetical protein
MHDNLHVCYEGGAIDLGFSRLAAGILSANDALPDPVARQRIAEDLLREAEQDGTLANIWGHAGLIAIAADFPDILKDFLHS